MKTLAIIGGGWVASYYGKNAKEMGVRTVAFSLKSGVADFTAFDKLYEVDILDFSSLLEICKQENVNGVVPTTELTIAPASYVAQEMNLVGIPFDVAKVITNKYRNRNAVRNIAELKNPQYLEINSFEELKNLNLQYPIILKPTSKGGKRGVVVVNSKNELKDAYEYTLKDSGNTLPMIAEEFIDGDMECSVESISYEGENYIIQITEKWTSGSPHCVELGHHQPANISEELKKKVILAIDKGLSAIGMENGVCHTEIKIKGKDIYLIEFNARPGGDHISYPLVDLSTGYPYLKEAIKVALGEFKPPIFDREKARCSGIILISEQTKEFEPLFDKCNQYKWCYEKHKVSDELSTIVHNNSYGTNYFIYAADSRPDFEKLIKEQ
jgi:biotin carboxylase